jgi:DNA-binding transcriptional LysR family regulator
MVGLRTVHLMDDEVSVIARRGHRMLAAKRVNARSLAGERWVMPADGTLPAAWLEHRMRALKLDPPRCAIRTGTFPTLLGLVAGSDLLAFQSWPTIERLPQYGELLRPLPLKSLTWKRAIGATIREQDYRSPAIDRVLEALKAAARRMQAG